MRFTITSREDHEHLRMILDHVYEFNPEYKDVFIKTYYVENKKIASLKFFNENKYVKYLMEIHESTTAELIKEMLPKKYDVLTFNEQVVHTMEDL